MPTLHDAPGTGPGTRGARVRELFGEAADLPPAERAAFLDQVCAGDAALREEVETLLRHDQSAGPDFLRTSAPARLGGPGVPDEPSPLPRRVGPYMLREVIGEGSFGVVYLADEDPPLARRVALKVIKLGMDTREVVARFELERAALARMDHPGIARVYAAGATLEGRPFFAMEHIDGAPIHAHCDARRFDIRARLALLVQVCRAVEHAHHKGVIHRDLKPGNVLVAAPEGRSAAKIIDFGVARALEPRTGRPGTGAGRMVGTPEYMSPEQAAGLDIDTRTDVYGLGVLLYELLVGTLPFEPERFRNASPAELERIIREVEPVRPGTRLSRLGAAGADVAARRGCEPGALARQLRGDLDWITMKCLEKDRERRYPSAGALAADLESFLAHRPVTARPPSRLYTARKFARRHRVGVASALTAAIALVGGTVGTALGLVRAVNAGRAEAEHRARAERRAYVAGIAAAEAATRTGLTALAREQLDRTPASMRGWEWRYLARASDRSLYTLRSEGGTVNAVAFSPDGARLASAGADTAVRLWRLGNAPAVERVIRTGTRTKAVAFSPDGARLAAAGADGVVRVWDTGAWEAVGTPAPHGAPIGALAFAPDGTRLATIADDGAVRIVDASSGAILRVLPGHTARGLALAFSPDGARIASSAEDRALRLWDAQTGDRIAALTEPSLFVSDLAFSPDSRVIAAISINGSLWLRDGRNGEALANIRTGAGEGGGVAFSPDGSRFAVGVQTGPVHLWALGPPSRPAETTRVAVLPGHTDTVTDTAYSPDGTLIASASADGTIRLWDADAGDEPVVLSGHTQRILGQALTRAGDWAATAAPDGTARLWDCIAQRPGPVLAMPHLDVTAVAFDSACPAPDRRLAACCADGTVRCWDRVGSSWVEGEVWSMPYYPSSLLWGADGRLIMGFADGFIRAVSAGGSGDAPPGSVQVAWPAHRSGIRALAISPDRRWLASGSEDGTAAVWDAATGAPVIPTIAHEGQVRRVAFTPDGRLLALPSFDGTIDVWDLAARHRRVLLRTGQINMAAAFSPDGTRLFSSGADDALRVWDTSDWEQVAVFIGQAGWFTGLSVSDDGQRLVAGASDGSVRIWSLAPALARREARRGGGDAP